MARRSLALAFACLLALASPAFGAKKLPKSFLWGVATAGFQGEMGPRAPNDPNSDWWAWVRDPENIQKKRVSGNLPEQAGSQWTNYSSDIALAPPQPKAKTHPLS